MNYIKGLNIPVVDILRRQESYLHGTFGDMSINGDLLFWTLEPRDEENAENISSIPAQQYTCSRIVSPTFGDTFVIEHVPGRSHILFHSGNRDQDTKGCILLGTTMGTLNSDKAIFGSKKAFTAFMKIMKGHDEFLLTIKEAY